MQEPMKQLVLATTLALAFSCSGSLDPAHVSTAERARAEAIAGQDTAAFGQLAAPDLLVVDQRGELQTKNDRMSAVGSGEARKARRSESDVMVRVYGDLALVIGRSVWQGEGAEQYDYFTRIWVNRDGHLQLVGGHHTDTTRSLTDKDPANHIAVLAQPVPPLPIATTWPGANAEDDLRQAIRDQHRAYWSKDPDRYRLYAGSDLLRISENGIRTREQLIVGMRANSRLPAPPSDQLDVRVRVFGNAAVTTYLDQGTDILGRPTQGRSTVVFVRRAAGWQMVHIQTSGVKQHVTSGTAEAVRPRPSM